MRIFGRAEEPATTVGKSRAKAGSDSRERVKRLSTITAVAVALAILGTLYGLYSSASAHSEIAEAKEGTVPTLIAKGAIEAGSVLSEEMFDVKDIPAEMRADGSVGQDGAVGDETIYGKKALVGIPAGGQITGTLVSGSAASGSLASAIRQGNEAVTIAVDIESGISGMIRQGDLVRLISVEKAADGSAYTKTICNADVTALDGELTGGDAGYTSVTVEVTPSQADDVRASQETGSVTLALASSLDASKGE